VQEVESEVNQPVTLDDDTQRFEDHPIENQLVVGNTTTLIVKEDGKKKEEEDDSLSVAAAFHNNDNKILAVLNETGSYYSFKGLMRKLNLHQQSLSRALRRLEELGIIEKSRAGYRLAVDVARTIAARDLPRQKGREYTQLLQTYIPVSIKAGEIIRSLVGKWFKNLRWLGMIESGTGYTLQWISDDGSFQINLRMISDYIIIETNASTEKEKVQAMAGSYTVYEQITKAIQSRLGTYLIEQHISSRNN
jgi:DNA-binding Lrp family transcriptional regulator